MISAATLNNVIEHVYTSTTYNQVISNLIYNSVHKSEDTYDIKHDIITQLYNVNADLVELYNRGAFKWYFVRLCQNQIKSKYSYIYYSYAKNSQVTDELNEFIHTSDYDAEDKFLNQYDQNDLFNRVVAFLNSKENKSRKLKVSISIYRLYYIDGYNIPEISKKINTCESNVFKYLKHAREIVAEEFTKN